MTGGISPRLTSDPPAWDERRMVDAVNSPAHYRRGGMEAIDAIEAFDLGMHLGNACKYVLRAGRKGDFAEDCRKAIWYLNRAIEHRAKQVAKMPTYEVAVDIKVGDPKLVATSKKPNGSKR